MDLDVMVGDDPEGGDIVLSVVAIDVLDLSDLQNKVLVRKLCSWPPKLFTILVDDVVLVGVGVNFPGTGGGVEEGGEEGDVHSIIIIRETKEDRSRGWDRSYGGGGSIGWSGE
jgi:hypothetical protein